MDILIHTLKNEFFINYRFGPHILFLPLQFSPFFAKERWDAAKFLFAHFYSIFSDAADGLHIA